MLKKLNGQLQRRRTLDEFKLKIDADVSSLKDPMPLEGRLEIIHSMNDTANELLKLGRSGEALLLYYLEGYKYYRRSDDPLIGIGV